MRTETLEVSLSARSRDTRRAGNSEAQACSAILLATEWLSAITRKGVLTSSKLLSSKSTRSKSGEVARSSSVPSVLVPLVHLRHGKMNVNRIFSEPVIDDTYMIGATAAGTYTSPSSKSAVRLWRAASPSTFSPSRSMCLRVHIAYIIAAQFIFVHIRSLCKMAGYVDRE